MQVNLKLISSNEMIKLNGNFRHKEMDTNVLSFPVGEDIQSIAGELGDIAMSFAYIDDEVQVQQIDKTPLDSLKTYLL